MADIAISFDFSRYAARLDEIADHLDDLDEVMDDIGAYMVRSIVNRILRSKREPKSGARWQSLAESTIARKGSSSILFDSGNLARSIEMNSSDKGGFTISAGADYAAYMQFGVRRTGGAVKGKSIPARPFMGFSEANKRRVATMLRDYISKGSVDAYGEVE